MTGSFTAGAEPPTQRRLDADHPWPGLASFLEEERQFFHGRDSEAARLLRMTRRERLGVLFGRSGLGKTSLPQAGLFPRLRAEHILPVYVRLDHSGDGASLSRQVTVAIARAATAAGYEAPSARDGETLWEYFHRADAKLWTERNRPAVPLLVFDQFEEMFTIGRASASRCAATGSFLIVWWLSIGIGVVDA